MSFLFFHTNIFYGEYTLLHCRLSANVLIKKKKKQNVAAMAHCLQSERCECFKLESHSQSPIGHNREIKSFSSTRSNFGDCQNVLFLPRRGINAVVVFNGEVVTWMRPLCISGEMRKREGKVKRTSYVNGIKAERAEWGCKRRKDAKAAAGYRWAMPGYFTEEE